MKCNPANPKENGIVDIWQETYPVRFGAIDKSDRLTLDAVFNFFQEAAISHAENLGCGREAMAQTGQGWVLSRITVLVERRPNYCETVTVRTWPRGGEKLFAIRYYDIRDKDDIPVVLAKSAWLIVDIEKRRPLRPQSIMENLPQNEGLDPIPAGTTAAAGLPERENLKKITEKKALYTDVDYNGHVNNVSYVKWIEDAVNLLHGSSERLEKSDRMRMDVNYLNEILPDEVIEIFYTETENAAGCAFAFEGRKKESGNAAGSAAGSAAFRAELQLL